MHPTSLAGPYGIGDFGPEAFCFADFLSSCGHKLWQVLPLNPTGYGDSPFQCFSASAGNPLLISLDKLVERGVLTSADLRAIPAFPAETVDFGRVIDWKVPLLKRAARNFLAAASTGDRSSFDSFCQANASWLDEFALFMACKDTQDMVAWTRWPAEIAARQPEALQAWKARLAHEIEANRYLQFEFFAQWQELRAYAGKRGIRVIGDIPIYVAHDSADVWANRELFCLDDAGLPTKMSGVPPDYFSATGQLWGNPIYNWPLLRKAGYQWWIERFRAALRLYDIMRIDHFRGFEAYWEIPAGEATATRGEWIKGPGADFFSALQAELGELSVIAENLGVITPEVEGLRRQFSLPGMAILQFAFGNDPQGPSFRPHNYARDLVAYTGTHDNDTVVGWWNSTGAGDSIRTPEDVAKEHRFARSYLGFTDEPVHWVLIRALLASVADTAIIPLQDILGLGSAARMNLPATLGGNWRWRVRPGAMTSEIAARLREMNTVYDR